jgi:hypothetical protein
MPEDEDKDERESIAVNGGELLLGSGFEEQQPDPVFANTSKPETEDSAR